MQIGLCWSKSAWPVNRVPTLSSVLISQRDCRQPNIFWMERDFMSFPFPPQLTRAAFKEQWKCVNVLSNCRGTVVPSANPFQTADMKREDFAKRRVRGIIRRRSFDQVNFHLITNIYIHTVDHTVGIVTICCSLLLKSWLYSCQEHAVLYILYRAGH